MICVERGEAHDYRHLRQEHLERPGEPFNAVCLECGPEHWQDVFYCTRCLEVRAG